jgi:N-acetylneuraminic acid mutarotase
MKRTFCNCLVFALLTGLALTPCPAQQWQVKSPLPELRSRAAGAIVGDHIYLMGGERLDASGNLVRPRAAYRYHIPSDTWSPIASLPHNGFGVGGVSNISAAVVGTDIYIPGGYAGGAGNARPELLRYDTLANVWQVVASDPYPTFPLSNPPFQSTGVLGAGVVALNEKVYAIGGYIEQSNPPHARTLVYNPVAPPGTRWQEVAPLNGPRGFLGAAIVNGGIWIGGGLDVALNPPFTLLHTFEAYDPDLELWDLQAAQAAVGRFGPGLYDVSGEPAIVGGGWATTHSPPVEPLNDAEILDSDSWVEWIPANDGSYTFAYAQSADGRYLVKVGGFGDWFLNSAEVLDFGGDLNCDGECNGLDIQPFVIALLDPDTYAAMYAGCHIALADVNADGNIDLADTAPFVERVLAL